jgi:YggT family protein
MNPLIGLANLLDLVLEVYLWIIFISIILSWIPLASSHPTAQKALWFLDRATEPVFGFVRRTFRLNRYTAPLDVTPLVVILAIYFLRIFVVQTLRNMAPVSNLVQAVFYTLNFVLTLYFWVVLIAGVLAVMVCFFPTHPWAGVRLPLIHNLTEPVFGFFRRLFRSHLQIHFHDFAQPLDAAPFLVLALIYIGKRLFLSFLNI